MTPADQLSGQSSRSGPAVAVVVAAGSGVRLGAGIPKALMPLGGVPLVARSVAALAAGGVTEAVVMIPAAERAAFTSALASAPIPVVLEPGGAQRQDSVRRGLARVDEASGPVLVHDAARPLVPAAVVAAVTEAVRAGADVVVPVLPVADSIRRVFHDGGSGAPGDNPGNGPEGVFHDGGSEVVERSALRVVQTPQAFELGVLRAGHAHVVDQRLQVTDDASACEAAGHRALLIPGSADSLKITTPIDLLVAEAILATRGKTAPH